ncbi:zinc finger protein Pegasus-like isoform X2 [Chionomys nivalis]|uniref:zinc finger protein Pegasus-like isoform X2 n=1 Tax=Chionomys nivalis TaxID=269649 RepID=UPI0025953C31|nr:zinc finger protein Pegasus-like isoform X2 [Chionomys nivalis]
MGEKRVEPQDFLKNFREYLSQQTRQVNELAWDLAEQARDPGLPGLPGDDDALDGSPVLMLDDLGRTLDGKLQCPYCSYASERAERLLEHTRIHTAGHLSSLPPENHNRISADVDSSLNENPFMIQQPSAQGSAPQSSPTVLEPHPPSFSHRDCSPFAGPSGQPSDHTTSTSILGNSQPSPPALTWLAEDPQLLFHCQHCDTYFADNVLYTIHMGCHGYDSPFRCNVCGYNCKNKYDFACHFARGQHN